MGLVGAIESLVLHFTRKVASVLREFSFPPPNLQHALAANDLFQLEDSNRLLSQNLTFDLFRMLFREHQSSIELATA